MPHRSHKDVVENYTAFVKSGLPSLTAPPLMSPSMSSSSPTSASATAAASQSSPLTPSQAPSAHLHMRHHDSVISNARMRSTTQRPSCTQLEQRDGYTGAASAPLARFSMSGSEADLINGSATAMLKSVAEPSPAVSPPGRMSSPPAPRQQQVHDFLLPTSAVASSAGALVAHGSEHSSIVSPTSSSYRRLRRTPPPPSPLAPEREGPSHLSGTPSSSASHVSEGGALSQRRVGSSRQISTAHTSQVTVSSEVPPRRMVRRTVLPPLLPTTTTATPTQLLHHSPISSVEQAPPHTGEKVSHARGLTETTHSWSTTTGTAMAASPGTPSHGLTDILSPTFHRSAPTDVGALVVAPGGPTETDPAAASLPMRETFPIPRYCPDDLLRGEDKLWAPGKPLRIAYITWNMANKAPRMEEVSSYCIHPNAHLVVVGTQENGPYLFSNKLQHRFVKAVAQKCLGGHYKLVQQHHMWAIQMLVFARSRDVAKYVSRAHSSHVKTGLCNGVGGNKGGVAVGIVLSLTPKFMEGSRAPTTHRPETTHQSTPRANGGRSAQPSASMRSASAGAKCDVPPMVPETDLDLMTSPVLSPNRIAGPSPPALLDAEVMRHDVDDDEYDATATFEPPPSTVSPPHGNRPIPVADPIPLYAAGDPLTSPGEGDGVFSPAEMRSRNASFDRTRLQREERRRKRGRRRRRNRKRHHPHNQSGDVEEDETDMDSSEGEPDSNSPNYMTLLFITAHLAAHQGAVFDRNKDYRQIVHCLQLGRRGPHKKFFKQLLRRKNVLDAGAGEEEELPSSGGEDDHWDDDSSGEDVLPLSLPTVAATVTGERVRRDVTEEFDLTFFGGDLNYRINGTRKAIEYVIQHHRNIRSILINNDQLSLERARGTVFQGYQEGNLHFRPTYKYEVSRSNGGVTLDAYNFSRKKDRMPAYCDRVLFKKKRSSAARRVAIRLYTDVPNVRTSDHRPVVSLFDVGTRAYTGPTTR